MGRYLRDRGLTVVGVDLSVSCVRTAKRCKLGMLLPAGDLAQLPFASEAFVGAVADHSLIHTSNRFLHILLQELPRAMAPGGRLLLAVEEGTEEGFAQERLCVSVPVYFARFTWEEVGRVL